MELPIWIFIFSRAGVDRSSRAQALLCALRYAEEFGLDAPSGEIVTGAGGKPLFTDGAVHFSVSHSGGLWACAVHDGEVGLDIQIEGERRADAIAQRFFCKSETEYLSSRPQDFFKVWCAKEAAVKYAGTGIARGFSDACVSDSERLLGELGEMGIWHFVPEEGYSGCLCARSGSEYRLIRDITAL